MRKRLLFVGTVMLLLVLPLLGVSMKGAPIGGYLEFPPMTQYVEHAEFSWIIFVIMAAGIVLSVLPFELKVLRSRGELKSRSSSEKAFPAWGWAGIMLGLAAWTLAWWQPGWFQAYQIYVFTPLWLSYVIVINALTYMRTGHCMITDRRGYLFLLFVVSAVFWWFFEYLNRFVQNWYYIGIGDVTPLRYIIYGSLPFSTVLPAVMGTYELLDSFPRIGAGLDDFGKVRISNPRLVSLIVLLLSSVGLLLIGVWPDWLYPLLWISPLCVLTSLQRLGGSDTIFKPIEEGRWRRIYILAMSALVCGFFWEFWNINSYSKWIYTVPFVGRFKIFEMPVLGFAGYLPFGLECAVISDMLVKRPLSESDSGSSKRHVRPTAVALLSIALASAVWLPALHLFFRPDPAERGEIADAIAEYHFELWSNPELRSAEIEKMRSNNAEWDFMGRTFLVLSFANMALDDATEKDRCLAVMDRIIDETIRLEKENGIYYFLMDYAKRSNFLSSRKRSIFQDGEIAVMLAARCLVEEKDDYRRMLSERVALMLDCMKEGPVLCAESYPDECWTFCNSVAAAAIRMADVVEKKDRSAFIQNWLSSIKSNLQEKETGLLVSSFKLNGEVCDGPEGSSIWTVVHCLKLLDPDYAEEQYWKAKREIAGSFVGFGYSMEWPSKLKGYTDIDSGPIIPILNISAGASGTAFLGAATFGDDEYFKSLLASLNYAGFPLRNNGMLRYCASNQVGDAVLLYAMVQGPLWAKVSSEWKKKKETGNEI